MTLTEFAAQTGYSLNHASQVELGNLNAGPRYLKAASNLFSCEIKDLTDPPAQTGEASADVAATAENSARSTART